MKSVNNKLKRRKCYRGFTLIELMVVIAVIGIISATVVVNFGKNPDRDVQLEKDRLATFIRDIQNKSLASEKVAGVTGKLCGFGVKMSGANVQGYYVSTASGDLDTDCSTLTGSAGINYTDVFTPKISGVSLALNGTSLFFLSPSGAAYFNGGTFPATFTISKSGANNATVQIERSGNIK